jgi:hypothetical protein
VLEASAIDYRRCLHGIDDVLDFAKGVDAARQAEVDIGATDAEGIDFAIQFFECGCELGHVAIGSAPLDGK